MVGWNLPALLTSFSASIDNNEVTCARYLNLAPAAGLIVIPA
jgi:hypothetical protein